MEPYLVFMDIDGTLIDNHQNVSIRTKKVIQDLQSQGVIFYIATGRMLSLAKLVQQKINDDVKIIASNGSVYQKGNHIHKEHLGWPALKEIFTITRNLGLSTNFFSTDKVYYTKEQPWLLSRLVRARVMSDKTGNRDFQSVNTLEKLHEASEQIINGITIERDNPEMLSQARKELLNSDLLNISSSSSENIELIPRRISKATAVRAISNQYNIPVERTIAFGNDMNDLEMLKAVGVGVAMENSPEKLKEDVNFVTDSNINDGIATFLEKYFDLR
ncbi:HAD family hydrolase [Pediococcus claussenii]|uniref:HAD hydrolase, IIB family protein n=1 Tax=Pediococcus claussenii (strain ATCC BAA-344 / DSM 14800 / JCM 18046 / KCTC 3811 / LMG 21948 / P06) TaxID=701521 RepID=G8PB67_PEDCP|nr:HAD family hydrolase [Pediococcus claussenii]AEV94696.1 HAD hydrolase, IIB family protein [Pediococcus claussenii ATCC BAA-344]ANZ69891.1 haloacid dehalogenase [Pediococcus claussenii]ANZ71708.1 haloacid dehalogenase [Pediococcus claussenii]